MVERYDDAPLPRAHAVPGGPGPLADGDQVPHHPRTPAPTRRQHAYGWTVAVVVLVVMLLGIAGWWA